MPVHLTIDHPEQNDIRLAPKFLELSSGHVQVRGTGNVLHIADPHLPDGANFTLTGDTRVTVEGECNLGTISVFALAPGASIEIGSWTSFHGSSLIAAHETAHIRIGAGSLVGPDCTFLVSDVHKILDQHSRERLNPAGDIVIEGHVWFAPRVSVRRNTIIGRDSVVGQGSAVSGTFPENCLLAGNPARVIRTGITWEF